MDCIVVAQGSGCDERGVAVVINCVDIGTVPHKKSNRGCACKSGSYMQRGPSSDAPALDVSPGCEEGADKGYVVVAGCGKE